MTEDKIAELQTKILLQQNALTDVLDGLLKACGSIQVIDMHLGEVWEELDEFKRWGADDD